MIGTRRSGANNGDIEYLARTANRLRQIASGHSAEFSMPRLTASERVKRDLAGTPDTSVETGVTK